MQPRAFVCNSFAVRYTIFSVLFWRKTAGGALLFMYFQVPNRLIMFTNSQASWDCGWVVLMFCGEEGVTSDQPLVQTGEWLYFRSLDALAQKQFSMIIVAATHYLCSFLFQRHVYLLIQEWQFLALSISLGQHL